MITEIILVLIVLIYVNREKFKLIILTHLIVLRGILAPNCFWYKISDLILSDGSGINLYNTNKQNYGDFVMKNIFGTNTFIVTNNKYVRIILDNSPNLFSVGKQKKTFFKSFMAKNVGVSTGCPWKKRRYMNEIALETDKLHIYSEKYNLDMAKHLVKWKSKSKLTYNDFNKLGKKMVAKIVFNTNHIDDVVFKIFSEANSVEVFYNPYFKINTKEYSNILYKHIDNPNKYSLIELCMSVADGDKEEVFHQIPHFIFPTVGLFISTIPRLLLLLCNHKQLFDKIIAEVYSIDDASHNDIYKLPFLRKCILETLRLNNPVITTFRTLTEDYTFDSKYSFKKGTQFIILNNPVLRETEFFEHPNRFIPSRWTPEMEKSYYAISFNQGPQRCPGKELAIYLAQIFMYNFIKIKNIGTEYNIVSDKLNINNIKQVINPCTIKFEFMRI